MSVLCFRLHSQLLFFFFFFSRQFNSYRSGGTQTRLNGFDLIGLNNVGLKTYRKWSPDAYKLIYEFVL